MKIDTIIHASWIAPVEPINTLYHDYSIAIHEGRIKDLLPKQGILDKYSSDVEIQLDNHLLIPGLFQYLWPKPLQTRRR